MSFPKFDLSQLKSCGDDVWISPLVSIRRPHLVTIGSHVAIDEFFVTSTAMEIGDYIHISPHVCIIGGEKGKLTLGNFANIAVKGTIICASDQLMGAGIVTAPNIPPEYRDSLIIEPVTCEDFSVIGANAVILPGVIIPEGTVIGAGSLVRKSDILEPWTIYTGNPLRPVTKRVRDRMIDFAVRLGYTYQ